MSPACRISNDAISPLLVAVRSRFEVVWSPKCRPPWRNTLKTGGCGRGGLRYGHNGVCRGVSFARRPLNMRVNPSKPKPLDLHVGAVAHTPPGG